MASWSVDCCIARVPVVPGCASWFPDCGIVLLRERECRSALEHRESCVWLSAWLCCVVCRVLVSVQRVVACDVWRFMLWFCCRFSHRVHSHV